jgi:nucleoside-diphosphate-sugar epimerase
MLLDKGHMPLILDVRAPRDLKKGAVFIEGSILDRSKLTEIFHGCDCIVHIAAWHGIHEDRGEKNSYDFFDLNVRGTFKVFEAAASLGIDKVIFISTTNVYRPSTLYGRSKILAELIAENYRSGRFAGYAGRSRRPGRKRSPNTSSSTCTPKLSKAWRPQMQSNGPMESSKDLRLIRLTP